LWRESAVTKSRSKRRRYSSEVRKALTISACSSRVELIQLGHPEIKPSKLLSGASFGLLLRNPGTCMCTNARWFRGPGNSVLRERSNARARAPGSAAVAAPPKYSIASSRSAASGQVRMQV
jgi:hypothetical protein